MANFEIALNNTLKHEGGYQDNPIDKGNYNSLGQLIGTNFGISAPTLENYLNYPPSKVNMQGLTRFIAEKIYFNNYWGNYKLNEIVSQHIANQLFDINVLQGPSAMADIVQDALNSIGYHITNDKSFGPVTRSTINKAILDGKKDVLNAAMIKEREKRLQSGYWTGWITRARTFFIDSTDEIGKKKV